MAMLLVVLIAAQAGTTVVPFLKAGQGPRAAGLGEAYTALTGDASAVFWNPAGLARVAKSEFALSHHQWFTGITDEVAHAAVRAGPGSLGLGLGFSREGGIEEWTEENLPGDTFGTWDGILSAGYGVSLGRFSAGAGAKLVTEDLHAAQAWGAGIDLGFMMEPVEQLSAGAALRHLGGLAFPGGVEPLPAELALGAGYRWRGLVGGLDIVVPFDNVPNLRVGVEYAFVPEFCLRVGYRSGPQSLARLGALSGLTAGLGVSISGLGLDYAFAPYGELGAVHRIGLRFAPQPRLPATLGRLRILVLAADSRQPVPAGVTVTSGRDSVLFSSSGSEFELESLEPGMLTVRTLAGEFQPRVDTVAVVAGRTRVLTVLMEPARYGEMKGRILDAATQLPLSGRIVYRGPVYGDEVVSGSGAFRIRNVPTGEYRLGISGPSEDYLPQACTLRVPADGAVERDFHLVRRRQTIVLEGINFETGTADIRPEFATVLDRAGEILRNTPDIRVELAGHTDPREINTREFPSNWELSQARAEAVRRYLVEKLGIAPERLTARGYADTQPIASNDSPEGMAKNRRTEFRIEE